MIMVVMKMIMMLIMMMIMMLMCDCFVHTFLSKRDGNISNGHRKPWTITKDLVITL